ncbi:hypothetical protein HRbin02_01853 [Candidatus Calditenuaceae archaeon HR02]|nr:hypothetical protein HRbin02_01853 [Candidatus Calditenuaceae archaeon HR02]
MCGAADFFGVYAAFKGPYLDYLSAGEAHLPEAYELSIHLEYSKSSIRDPRVFPREFFSRLLLRRVAGVQVSLRTSAGRRFYRSRVSG